MKKRLTCLVLILMAVLGFNSIVYAGCDDYPPIGGRAIIVDYDLE